MLQAPQFFACFLRHSYRFRSCPTICVILSYSSDLTEPSNRQKRSSMNRPVLKLQIKPETLKRRTQRRQNGGVSTSIQDRDSGDYGETHDLAC